ncbi:MAG: hypothetical protein ABW061_08635 [Polyangiaceae bacterium]
MVDSGEKSVRGMGMGCGIFLMGIATLFVAVAVLNLVPVLSSANPKATLTDSAGPVLTFALLAAAAGAYGRSVFRRSRNDATVTTTIGELPQEGDHRVLAWLALGFGSLMVIGGSVATWLRIAAGHVPHAYSYTLPALIARPVGGARYLLRRRRAAAEKFR